MLLLELSAWPWLERLTRREGRHVTLASVPSAEWDRLARDGVDHLFLMGVWSRSATGRDIARTDPGLLREYDRALPGWTIDDVPGSPYSIRDYIPDPRMGGWAGLAAARAALNARGIRLVLDFVPNHTGFDHPWVRSHPRRYVVGSADAARRSPGAFRQVDTAEGPLYLACARDPHFPPWTDVAQLNYCNPATREAMRGLLAELAEHCDGVRCDMAMLVTNEVFEQTWRPVLGEHYPRLPAEFWPAATTAVPALLYLAEVYWHQEQAMLDQGFDVACDKRLLDALHAADAAARVRQLLASELPVPSRLARFLENHDEPRSAASLGTRLPAAVALALTLPGMRFLFDGQREGRRLRTPVQLGRWADEPVVGGVQSLYDRALRFASGIEPLARGGSHPVTAWRLLETGPASGDSWVHLVACRWKWSGGLAIVVVNLGTSAAEGHVAVAEDLPADYGAFDMDDALGGERYRWALEDLRRGGLYVKLAPGGAHLFMVRPVPPRAS